jgi:hypothetical protein
MSKEPVGSVAEEAAKLFALLQKGDPGEHPEHRLGPECQWCPICQLLAVVRQAKPETVDHLASAAAGVLGSLRALLDAATESARQARAASQEPDPKDESPTDGQAGVDRIDVSEDPEPWD